MIGRENQRGVVLVVSMLAMTCVVLFGLAYLEVATIQLEQPDAAIARAQTRSLAEGGVEVGIRKLMDDPTFRGTIGPVTVGNGSYEVTISETAGVIEIDSDGVATATGSSSGMVALVAVGGIPVEDMEITHTFMVGDEILVQHGSATWGSTVSAVNGVTVGTGGDFSGEVVPNPEFTPIVIDVSAMQALATQTFVAADELTPVSLGPGTMYGEIFVDGDLEVTAPFDFTGTLMVDGSVKFEGKKPGDDVSLNSGGDATVIVSTGNVNFNKNPTTTINGSVFVLGPFQMQWTDFTCNGSVVTNDKIHFKRCDGTWNFDPAIIDHAPSVVSHQGSSSSSSSSPDDLFSSGDGGSLSFGGDSLSTNDGVTDGSTDSYGNSHVESNSDSTPVILSVRPRR